MHFPRGTPTRCREDVSPTMPSRVTSATPRGLIMSLHRGCPAHRLALTRSLPVQLAPMSPGPKLLAGRVLRGRHRRSTIMRDIAHPTVSLPLTGSPRDVAAEPAEAAASAGPERARRPELEYLE